MNEYREQLDEARAKGLEQRHQFRLDHAVESALKGEWLDTPLTRMLQHAQTVGRSEAVEEIASALEAYVANYPEDVFPPDGTSSDCIAAKAMRHAYPNAARIAREIGAGDGN